MRRLGIACTLSLALGATSLADPPARQPWQWTIENRLAERFDPLRIEEREREYRETNAGRLRSAQTDDAGQADRRVVSYVIDGRRNPELFLPHELFDSLMTGFTPDESLRAKQRQFYGPSIRAFGLEEGEFWDRLSQVAEEYAHLKYESLATDGRHNRQAQVSVCRARHGALQAARQAFGSAVFDRFLYTVIAPTVDYASATTHEDPVAALRAAEGGCR